LFFYLLIWSLNPHLWRSIALAIEKQAVESLVLSTEDQNRILAEICISVSDFWLGRNGFW